MKNQEISDERKFTILIIDDHDEFRRMLERLLVQNGYDVISASGVTEGVNLFLRNTTDLVITDIQMPGKNGVELLQEIKSIDEDVDVLVLTGHSDENTAISCLKLGAFDYLLKPLDNTELLLLAVARAIDKKLLEEFIKQQKADLSKLNLELVTEVKLRKEAEEEKDEIIEELKNALAQVKKLQGLLPICSSCKKVRDDQGYWNEIEHYIEEHSDAQFSHGICETCAEKMYGTSEWYQKLKDDGKLESIPKKPEKKNNLDE